MSIAAVNKSGVETSKKRNSATIAIPTIGLGAVGAGTGYLAGGKGPKLEDIFAMEPDKFESYVRNVNDDLENNVDEIRESIKDLHEDGSEYVVDKGKQKAYDAEVEKQILPQDSQEETNYKQAKENYDKKLLEKLNEGKEESSKFKTLDEADDAAKNAAKQAISESNEAKALTTAENNIRAVKEDLLRKSTDAQAKNIVVEFDNAVEAAKNKKAAKIAEFIGDENVKSAFEKIKKLFPKEGKGKTAAIWGAFGASLGLIAGLVINGTRKQS